jgi:hypothetical protein
VGVGDAEGRGQEVLLGKAERVHVVCVEGAEVEHRPLREGVDVGRREGVDRPLDGRGAEPVDQRQEKADVHPVGAAEALDGGAGEDVRGARRQPDAGEGAGARRSRLAVERQQRGDRGPVGGEVGVVAAVLDAAPQQCRVGIVAGRVDREVTGPGDRSQPVASAQVDRLRRGAHAELGRHTVGGVWTPTGDDHRATAGEPGGEAAADMAVATDDDSAAHG